MKDPIAFFSHFALFWNKKIVDEGFSNNSLKLKAFELSLFFNSDSMVF